MVKRRTHASAACTGGRRSAAPPAREAESATAIAGSALALPHMHRRLQSHSKAQCGYKRMNALQIPFPASHLASHTERTLAQCCTEQNTKQTHPELRLTELTSYAFYLLSTRCTSSIPGSCAPLDRRTPPCLSESACQDMIFKALQFYRLS